VLDAAFRQGYNLAYGCREGQCSACKCFLQAGDVDLKRYSNFALSDAERGNGYALMCRAIPESDLVVELLHFDPENYRLENAIREAAATVLEITELTGDIVGVTLSVPEDLSWLPGQYLDLHVPGGDGERRSFSIANLPGVGRVELMITRYPGGRLSGMLGDEIVADSKLRFTGPYGAFHLRRSEAPILMVAGGSGMAPVLGVLRQLAAEECERPVRFYYGAREERDLFALEEIARLAERLEDFCFIPVTGRFVHEAISEELDTPDVYMCGRPPMLDAVQELPASRRAYTSPVVRSVSALGEQLVGLVARESDAAVKRHVRVDDHAVGARSGLVGHARPVHGSGLDRECVGVLHVGPEDVGCAIPDVGDSADDGVIEHALLVLDRRAVKQAGQHEQQRHDEDSGGAGVVARHRRRHVGAPAA
jgi:propane monooxygenase reductase component